MSHVDDALKILDTPEAEGGLADYEKILAVRNLLRTPEAPVEVAPAPVAVVEPVVTPAAEVVAVVAEVPPAPTV